MKLKVTDGFYKEVSKSKKGYLFFDIKTAIAKGRKERKIIELSLICTDRLFNIERKLNFKVDPKVKISKFSLLRIGSKEEDIKNTILTIDYALSRISEFLTSIKFKYNNNYSVFINKKSVKNDFSKAVEENRKKDQNLQNFIKKMYCLDEFKYEISIPDNPTKEEFQITIKKLAELYGFTYGEKVNNKIIFKLDDRNLSTLIVTKGIYRNYRTEDEIAKFLIEHKLSDDKMERYVEKIKNLGKRMVYLISYFEKMKGSDFYGSLEHIDAKIDDSFAKHVLDRKFKSIAKTVKNKELKVSEEEAFERLARDFGNKFIMKELHKTKMEKDLWEGIIQIHNQLYADEE